MNLRQLLFVIAAVFFIQQCWGQAPTEKTLLWRISGHGLQQPSYLFGTIHMNDKRLFRFDDSVYKAIEKTDGLAIEVDPNEIAAAMVNKLIDSEENGKKIKEILNKKDFNKYSAALSKKLHKPADDITTADIAKEKDKWVGDNLQKGEMPTFVDGYLYSLARKQGKWVGGVEDVADQTTLMEDIVDKSDIQAMASDDNGEGSAGNDPDDIINLYISQNIEKMSDPGASDPAQQDALITKRNIKMARRMDSLSAIRTMFFAVGSAHLGGEAGVISLLRQRGFTVEPVFSKTKTYSTDYHFTEVPQKWVTVVDSSHFYTVEMPGNPSDIKMYGLIDMNFLFDITNYSAYATMAVLSPGGYSNQDSIFMGMTNRMFKSTDKHSYKAIEKNGVEGREYTNTNEEGNVRVQLFLKNNIVYLAMLYALKKEELYKPAADKYFASLSIKDLPAEGYRGKFSNAALALSFDAPVAMEENRQMEEKMNPDSTTKSYAFTGIDVRTGSYILLTVTSTQKGYSFTNDSLVIANVYTNLNQSLVNAQMEKTTIQGYSAAYLEGKSGEDSHLRMKVLAVSRGNNTICLDYVGDSANLHSEAVDSMYNSFRLMPYPQSKWSNQTAPDHSFSIWSPSAITVYEAKEGEFDHKQQFMFFDAASSTTMFVDRDTLSKYTWVDNDSAFWEKRREEYTSEDSVLAEKRTKNGNYKGDEFLYRYRNAKTVKRVRFVIDGNLLYYVYIVGDSAVVNGDDADKMFNSFLPTSQAPAFDLYSHKTALILHDLASEQDPATRDKALSALKEAKFTAEDVPLLQDAVFKKYTSVYQDSVTDMVNQRIADKLNDVNDKATLAYMVAQYPSLKGDKEYLKNTALDYVSYLKTKEGFTALSDMLLNYPAHYLFDDNNITTDLKDTLALTYSTLYPQVLQLGADSIAGQMVANVTHELVDSGFLKITDIQNSEAAFIALSTKLLPALIEEDDPGYIYNMHPLLRLLGSYNTPEALKAVRNYLAVKYLYLRKTAILVLADKNQPIDTASLNSVAASPSTALGLYHGLKEIDKEALFPKKYRTQSNFAASEIYTANDDDDPVAVESVGSKIAECKGKKYKFYLFKVSYVNDADTTSYLGVAGGYDIGGKLMEPGDDEDFTRVYTKEQYDATAVEEQFDAFIQEVNEEEQNQ